MNNQYFHSRTVNSSCWSVYIFPMAATGINTERVSLWRGRAALCKPPLFWGNPLGLVTLLVGEKILDPPICSHLEPWELLVGLLFRRLGRLFMGSLDQPCTAVMMRRHAGYTARGTWNFYRRACIRYVATVAASYHVVKFGFVCSSEGPNWRYKRQLQLHPKNYKLCVTVSLDNSQDASC